MYVSAVPISCTLVTLASISQYAPLVLASDLSSEALGALFFYAHVIARVLPF